MDSILDKKEPYDAKLVVKLRQGSGKDRQGMVLKAKGLKLKA